MFSEVGQSTRSPDLERRVSIAFFSQPFVAAAVALAVFPAPVAVAVWIVAIPITGCAAYPAYEWLLRRQSITFAWTFLAGIVCGNIPAFVALVLMSLSGLTSTGHLPPVSELAHGVERAVAVGSLAGAVSASVFWLIAGRFVASRCDGTPATN